MSFVYFFVQLNHCVLHRVFVPQAQSTGYHVPATSPALLFLPHPLNLPHLPHPQHVHQHALCKCAPQPVTQAVARHPLFCHHPHPHQWSFVNHRVLLPVVLPLCHHHHLHHPHLHLHRQWFALQHVSRALAVCQHVQRFVASEVIRQVRILSTKLELYGRASKQFKQASNRGTQLDYWYLVLWFTKCHFCTYRIKGLLLCIREHILTIVKKCIVKYC